MDWIVDYHADYLRELRAELDAIQSEVFALVELLKKFGPQLGRPWRDTLNGSRFPNMKERRFSLPYGEWRVAFAFDPKRHALLLVGGSKSGKNQGRFYRDLIRTADTRFSDHLETLKSHQGGT